MQTRTGTFALLALALTAAGSGAALAQTATTTEQRLDRAEQRLDEMEKRHKAELDERDRKIAELLRNFVRHHGQRRADSQRHRRQDGRADHHAVEKIMERVPDEHHRRGQSVSLAVVCVAVAPEPELFEHEKPDDAAEK